MISKIRNWIRVTFTVLVYMPVYFLYAFMGIVMDKLDERVTELRKREDDLWCHIESQRVDAQRLADRYDWQQDQIRRHIQMVHDSVLISNTQAIEILESLLDSPDDLANR